jgi:hypothetical protein
MVTETIPDGDFYHYPVMPLTTSGVRCDVCDVHVGPIGKAQRHRGEAGHLDRMKRVVDFQKCPIKIWCANIKHRLESPSREREAAPWTLEVYSMLFWFLMGYQAWPDRQVESRKQDILNLLYEHEQHERMMLLQLAVWKFACVLNPIQEGNAEVDDESYWDWANWSRHGWKRRKLSTHRNSVEINAIINGVRPFLAKETAMSWK